jgi:2-aminoadipate transaminase
MQLPALDPAGPTPLVDQLVAHFHGLIEAGRLRAGERLPTIRAVAGNGGLTRATVQAAYRRLNDMGLVSSTVGRGTTVRAGRSGRRTEGVVSPGAQAAYRQLLRQPQLAMGGTPVCDLAALHPDPDLFPVAAFAASLDRVIRTRGSSLLGYGEPTGDRELRYHLATVAAADGGTTGSPPASPAGTAAAPRAVADEILVTSGAQQGIDLVLRTLTRPGDGVAMALPTYHHLFGLLELHGLACVPVRAGAEGFDLDDLARVLAREDVALLYVMPSFHNPTGRTLDLDQRRALMEVVAATGVPVLEDEFEMELRFRGGRLPTLRSLDPRGLTATIRTFSKGLFPGVRMGWIQADAEILGPMAAVKRYSDLDTSALLQAALLDFLKTPDFAAFRLELCAVVAARHGSAQAALARHMPPGFCWTEPEGGYVVWVEGPPGFDSDQLARTAAERGVLISPGSLFHPSDAPVAGWRISLSRTDPAGIEAGIAILGRGAAEMLGTAAGGPSHRPLLL